MLSTSTKTMGTMAEDQSSVKSEDSLTGRAKFMCSYGGKIMPRPHDSQLRYVGGETRILSVQRSIVFLELMSKLKKLCNNDNVCLKYQLPNEDLDALISVLSDEDLENMMEEYEKVESKDSSSRLRLFLFPAAGKPMAEDNVVSSVKAVNGVLLRKPEPTIQVPSVLNEEAKKHVAVLQPATPPIAERQVPVPAAVGNIVPVAPASNVVPVAPSPRVQQVLVPQVPYVPGGGAATVSATLPQILGASSVVPPIVAAAPTPATATAVTTTLAAPAAAAASPVIPTVATATQAAQAAGLSQVLPGQLPASVLPNVVVPRVLPPTAPVPAAPVVRVAPSGGTSIALMPTQVISGGQGPQVIPQVIAHRPLITTTQPSASKLDVFRGVLPKGVVFRQYPVDEDSASSCSSQMTVPATSELIGMDKRDVVEEVHERPLSKALDHGLVERLQELAISNKVASGTQTKVADSHLERYLAEQTMDAAGVTATVAATHPQANVHFYIPDVTTAHRQQATELPQRVASAPLMPTVVDTQIVNAKYLNRQFSDHQQDNSPATSMRPPIAGVHLHQHHQVPAEMVLQIDERGLSKPLLHQVNGVIRQAQEPVVAVPQFVGISPFHQTGQ